MLSYMECFSLVTTASQSEPVSSADVRATSATRFKRWCGEILDETFKFIQSKTFVDTWLFKEILFISECIYPRESRRRNWKSCRWMLDIWI